MVLLEGGSSALELPRDFSKRMNELADRRFEDEELQLLKEDQHSPSQWRMLMSLLQLDGHFGRLFLSFLGQVSQVDVYGGHQASGLTQTHEVWRQSKTRQHFDERYNSVGKLFWLHRTLCFLYCLSAMSLAVNSVFQYQYDYHFIRWQTLQAIVRPGQSTLDMSYYLQAFGRSPLVRVIRALNFQESSMRHTNTTSSPLQLLERHFEDRVQSLRHYLELFGSPYMMLNFLIEIIYWILITMAIYLCGFLNFYYRLMAPFDYSLLRAVLDWRNERRLINNIIRNEVEKYIFSSRNFAQVCVEKTKFTTRHMQVCSMLHRNGKMQSNRDVWHPIHSAKNELRRQLLDHISCCNQLKQMALDGSLMPRNRTLRQIRIFTEGIIIFCLLFMGYTYGAAILFGFGFLLVSDYNIEVTLMNILVIFQAGILVIVLMAISSFYISLVGANFVDQICYVRHIRNKISECISNNEHYFNQCNLQKDNQQVANALNREVATLKRRCTLQLPHRELSEQVSRLDDEFNRKVRKHSLAAMADFNFTQMNKNLLEVIMHYKIFIAQLRPVTRSFGPFLFGCLIIMIVLPFSLRLHVIYLNYTFKLYAMFFSFILASVADVVLVPLCHMYTRCLHLQKSLSSLLAHTLEVTRDASNNQQETSDPISNESSLDEENPGAKQAQRFTRIYDSHTIWLLRKELSHPEQMHSQFSIYTFGISLTYDNLLRVHFWVSLLSLSMMIQTSAVSEVAENDGHKAGSSILGNSGSKAQPERYLRHQRDFFSSLLTDPFRVFEL